MLFKVRIEIKNYAKNRLACFSIEDQGSVEVLAGQEIMKKWWAYMKDIMKTNDDDSPVSTPLKEVFYLP